MVWNLLVVHAPGRLDVSQKVEPSSLKRGCRSVRAVGGRLQSLPDNFRQKGLEEVGNVLRTTEDFIQGIGARRVGQTVAAETLVKHFRAGQIRAGRTGGVFMGVVLGPLPSSQLANKPFPHSSDRGTGHRALGSDTSSGTGGCPCEGVGGTLVPAEGSSGSGMTDSAQLGGIPPEEEDVL